MIESIGLLIGLLIAALLGIATGGIAKNKGYDPLIWGVFGFALAIVALPVILLMPPQEGSESLQPASTKQCPYCAEIIKRAAKVCRYCGKDQPANTLQNECPQCGLVNFANAEFCRHCEAEL